MAKPGGRTEWKKTQGSRQHAEPLPPEHPYRDPADPELLLQDQFAVAFMPGTGARMLADRYIPEKEPRLLSYDKEILSLEWTDAEGARTGTIVVNLGTQVEKVKAAKPKTGWLGVLFWRRTPRGRWREIWRMRLMDPSVSLPSGELSASLIDDLAYLKLSKDHFKYGKDKKHPNGMPLEKIIREICNDYHQPVGKLARMKDTVDKFSVDGTPYDAILKAIKIAENKSDSNLKLVVRSRKGLLDIVPLRPSPDSLTLGAALIDSTYTETIKGKFATALTVRGTAGGDAKTSKKDKKAKKKVVVEVYARKAIQRFGYIMDNIKADEKITSPSGLRYFGLKELRKRMQPGREVSFTHPGIPTVERWDAIQLRLGSYGPQGALGERPLGPEYQVFVDQVTHSVSPGDYTMSVTCQFADPFIDDSEEGKLRRKCQVARDRGRPEADACKQLQDLREKDKKKDQHKDDPDKKKPKTKKAAQ